MPALDKQDQRAKEANDNGPKANKSKQNRIYLDVPFEENQKAYKLGARFDREVGVWFAPNAKAVEKTKRWSIEGKVPAAVEKRDPVQEFSEWLRAQGMDLKGPAIMDGKWHRIAIMGEKAKNASYRAHLDASVPNGMLNNFKGDQSHWKLEGVKLSKDAVAKAIEAGKKAQKERAEELKQDQEKAAKTAFGIWSNISEWAKPSNCDYLKRKNVRGYGVKLDKDGRMVVPLRDTDFRIHSLQFVGEEKHYLKNGRKEGLFHAIDPDRLLSSKKPLGVEDIIVFAEGYATGGTMHDLLEKPTVIAFDGDNLVKVAKALREKFPEATMLFAADDDHHLPLRVPPLANKGQEKAREAAQAVDGYVVSPPLNKAEKAKELTDWNDLRNERGLEKTEYQLKCQLSVAFHQGKERQQDTELTNSREKKQELEVA